MLVAVPVEPDVVDEGTFAFVAGVADPAVPMAEEATTAAED